MITRFHIITAAACLVASHAQAQVADCYALPAPQDGVEEMVVTARGDITYTLPDLPQVLFFTSCGILENDTFECSFGCDGGGMKMHHTAEDLRIVSNSRVEVMRLDSILAAQPRDAEGIMLTGDFRLKPVDLEICRAIENRTPDIELQAGDVNVMVESLEESLISGGYLIGTADTIFDDRTRTALIAYQAEAGLSATGRAGPKIRRQLATDSVLAFGGC
ncbi:peptidoglycan-binding domain-containing protein [Lentibacter sp. XHP0401]|uniref:peptidoglycan-binding domain-containing protein n=1 Tax=Lentibacter sp. XHP0401 TaxID=2984334 RepID=UPI0021E7015A|nr:peptidoglycan-binding domain-containing protein [Lentibacter sp. XHP0401]MCV2894626.1 peptidoglycan-binding protein [Lentibacter sp. XHP0401]